MGGLGPGKNQNPAWILLLDRATGEIRQKFEAHSAQVPSVVIPPDFLIASSSGDNNTVRLWGPGLGLLLNTFDAKAFSLIFSPDSQIPALAFLSRIDFLRSLVSGNLVQKSDLIRRRRRIKTNYSGPKRPVSNHSGVFFFEKPQCGDSTINPPQSGFELNIDKEDWICINNERVLWLPVEFRPTCRVVFGGKIAFTTPSGMVYVMEFCANIG
ncbi:unnamed protein product [Penicillium salamii]|nr:unnamed protein product [Penicillium salamii]